LTKARQLPYCDYQYSVVISHDDTLISYFRPATREAATLPMQTTETGVQQFHMESITAGNCAVLRVAGDIDGHTAPELRQRVIHLADNGTLHIIADLRSVDFLDSTGLGVLVGGLKRLRMREGSLAMVTSGGRILQLFEITGLSRVFALHSCVPDAITADQHWQATLAGQGDNAREWCQANGLM
jgi:anti-sigma B factor antagonist